MSEFETMLAMYEAVEGKIASNHERYQPYYDEYDEFEERLAGIKYVKYGNVCWVAKKEDILYDFIAMKHLQELSK